MIYLRHTDDRGQTHFLGRRFLITNLIGCNVKWIGQYEHWMPEEARNLV